MKIFQLNHWFLPILLVILIQAPLFPEQAGLVTRLKGNADVTRNNNPAILLKQGDGVYERDLIRTKSNSLLVVTMKDKGQLTLAENSKIVISKYITGKKPAGLLNLSRGKLRAYVTDEFSKRSESFQVRTPTAIAGVQGTEFVVAVHSRYTQVYVYHGVVVVYNVNRAVKGRQVLYAGQQTIVMEGEPPTEPLPFDLRTGKVPGASKDENSNAKSGGNDVNPDTNFERVTPEKPAVDQPPPADNPTVDEPPPAADQPPAGEPPPTDNPPATNPPHGRGRGVGPNNPPGKNRPVDEHPSRRLPPGLTR